MDLIKEGVGVRSKENESRVLQLLDDVKAKDQIIAQLKNNGEKE